MTKITSIWDSWRRTRGEVGWTVSYVVILCCVPGKQGGKNLTHLPSLKQGRFQQWCVCVCVCVYMSVCVSKQACMYAGMCVCRCNGLVIEPRAPCMLNILSHWAWPSSEALMQVSLYSCILPLWSSSPLPPTPQLPRRDLCCSEDQMVPTMIQYKYRYQYKIKVNSLARHDMVGYQLL
jgi:hypothetical protein